MRVNIRIVESKRSLNEGLPRELHLTKSEKDLLLRRGVDLQNAPSDWVEITSNRDPRLKSGVNVFVIPSRFGGDYENRVLSLNGEIITDTTYDRIGSGSWKGLINAASKIWHLDVRKEDTDAMRLKVADRARARKGMIKRHNPDDPDYRRANLDKSGYSIPGPEKYKAMLAELKLTKYQSVLKDAKDVYIALASAIDKIDIATGSSQYSRVMRDIASNYKDLERSYADYQKVKDDPEEYKGSYERGRVLYTLRQLDDNVKEGRQILSQYED